MNSHDPRMDAHIAKSQPSSPSRSSNSFACATALEWLAKGKPCNWKYLTC